MAEHVINEMTKNDYNVLCIHDSFIVISANEGRLQALMEEAFARILSALTDLNDKAISEISKIGMGANEVLPLWETTIDYNELEKAQKATKKLFPYTDMGKMDLEFTRRAAEYNKRFKNESKKDYYREDLESGNFQD